MKQRNNPFDVKAASCALAALLSASPLFATTYYLNFSESGGDGANSHAWTNLVHWSTTAGTKGDANHPSSFSSDDEFVVSPHSNGFTLRTITDVSEWIGKCLRVGGEPHLNASSLAVLRHQIRGEDVSVTYRNDGLVLGDRGRYYAYYGKGKVCHIYGTITVESTSANYSAQLYSANQENSSLHFHDAFKGNADARLKILNTTENFTVKIDNPTAYYGTITSTNTVDNVNNNGSSGIGVGRFMPHPERLALCLWSLERC